MPVSMLNDVLGPVMRGPSSSHTAGAYRISVILGSLLGDRPVQVAWRFDPDGSYAPTYRALGVDLAVAAGAMGWDMTDTRYANALAAAADAGIDVSFSVGPLAHADHPNAVYVEMKSERGEALTAWARSVGGGAVEITRIDEHKVLLDGKAWEALVTVSHAGAPAVVAAAGELLGAPCAASESRADTLLHFRRAAPIAPEAVAAIAALKGVVRARVAPPIVYPQQGASPWESAAEVVSYAESIGESLGAAACGREARALGRTEAEVTSEMLRRFAVMRDSVTRGLDDTTVDMPLTRPSASRILAAETQGRLAMGGIATRAAARAMACMHTCNSRGVVCAAPTGGSAGVLPGVLVTLAEDRGVPEAAVARALFAASAIGAVIAARATFAAEVAGCQVEIGAAGAMAAAAVCELAGGTPRACADAAAVALQNTMGSVCDPVQGGCEIPCHTRNAAAAAAAFVCADLVLGGYVNPIPLDETIDAAYAVGKMLPRELRCTALGGIAAAPSAKRLKR